MKLSFSIPSKRKPSFPSKPSNNFREYLTEFNSSKTLSAPNPDIIIPPKHNTFNPFKKMCGIIPDPSADSDLRFEIEDSSIADPASKSIFSYDLNLRNPSRRPQKGRMVGAGMLNQRGFDLGHMNYWFLNDYNKHVWVRCIESTWSPFMGSLPFPFAF